MAEQKSSLISWAQVIATASIGLAGLLFTLQQEQNRKAQTAVELMSHREEAEIGFRKQMFDTMILGLLDNKRPVEERFTVLKIFQHNFHDLFNGRALFDVLAEDAKVQLGNTSPRYRDFIDHLVSLAKEVNRSQEQLVGGDVRIFKLIKDSLYTISLDFKDEEHAHSKSKESHIAYLRLDLVKENSVYVNLRLLDQDEMIDTSVDSFWVSYYDAPLTDNILLKDGHRFAIVLKEVNPNSKEATLKLIHFPAHYVTTGYRPSIERVNEMLRH